MGDLHVFWFLMLGLLLTVYAVLDGFDLGVGTLHLFSRTDLERRTALNSIGPLWDGNEVWLVTFGGALFAAFPEAYGTILSSLYLPVVCLLFFLIGRAVAIEFRSKHVHPHWRAYWDFSFAAASTLTTFTFGMFAGNLILGLPLDAERRFTGSLGDLLSPYALSVGVLAVLGSAMHGALFLRLKTEDELQAKVTRWAWTGFGLFLVAYVGVTIATLVLVPSATRNFERWPIAWTLVVAHVLAIANVPRTLFLKRPREAFASSCAVVAILCFLFGMAMYPNLAFSRGGVGPALDVFNTSSSEGTLARMQLIAFFGMPFVVTYSFIVYRVFHGRVKIGKFSY
jgi:cytochrome bd ubiquinol oxidase subunit II